MDRLLKASNIFIRFGDRPALEDVSLSLAAGQIIAILGPNGSGKTTLIRALLGQLPIHEKTPDDKTAGPDKTARPGARAEILWNARPIQHWKRRDLARLVAYLPQTPGFEPGQTVLDVLRQGRAPYWGAFGLESSADEKIVSDIAAMLSLTDLLHRSIEQLSGGQRQRVFVGRCLAQKPGALLLDEPSTFLDLAHQIELCQLLRDLSRKQNLAVLMATHDLNLAGAFADRLILLHRGKVAAEGSPDQVLRAEVLTPVYGVEIQRIDIAGKQPVVIPALGLARE